MTDQIIGLLYTLCMMGVPLDNHSSAFRDNHIIIWQSNNIPESMVMKHCNALAFHPVCEVIASGFLQLPHISRNEILLISSQNSLAMRKP